MQRWLLGFLLLWACQPTTDSPPPGDSWLRGSDDERFAAVERQLRGFDVAMVEVGYRYSELYFAGSDRNWEYAAYQLDKIRTAIDLGLVRRPKRAESAAVLESALEPLASAIDRRDSADFARRFDQLTATCNACHRAERVAFMHVVRPTNRRSSIRGPEEKP